MREKRHALPESGPSLRRHLNVDQQRVLPEVESFGWQLEFVRHPQSFDQVAVMYDVRRHHYAVLEDDGRLNEYPAIALRY